MPFFKTIYAVLSRNRGDIEEVVVTDQFPEWAMNVLDLGAGSMRTFNCEHYLSYTLICTFMNVDINKKHLNCASPFYRNFYVTMILCNSMLLHRSLNCACCHVGSLRSKTAS